MANKEWAKDNPERKKEIANAYSERNRETLREKSKLNYNVALSRDQHYKRTYGISTLDYDTLVEQQKGKCKICGLPPNTHHKSLRLRRLHIDHCHITGKVRGLLCFKCNSGLGRFNDNSALVKQALHYLINYERTN